MYEYNADLELIPKIPDSLDIPPNNITETPQVPNKDITETFQVPIQDNEKLTRLKILADEEASLFNELKLLEGKRS